MNSFERGCKVEKNGMDVLLPFIISRAYQGRVVPLFGNAQNKELQQYGDILMNTESDKYITIDLKIENRFTGNFFIETWSNKSRFNQGWVYKCKSDRIFYYFLDKPEIFYSIFVEKFKAWLFESVGNKPRLFSFIEAKQSKYDQMNDTWGVIIPIDVALGSNSVKAVELPPELINAALIEKAVE
jgi:hypothetical protein